MLEYLNCQDISKVKKIILVNGEYDTQLEWAEKLENAGFKDIIIPEIGYELELE